MEGRGLCLCKLGQLFGELIRALGCVNGGVLSVIPAIHDLWTVKQRAQHQNTKQNNEKFVIWGDGTPLRQFLFSEDLANLIVWGLQNWNSEEHCMLVNEQEISVLEVANIIKKYFDFDETDIIFDETKPKGQFRKPAISNASNFNFKSIEDGLKETIDWFIKNYNSCRK